MLVSHLQRVRDLTEQAANGTYGSQSLKAIHSEVYARLQEVSRLSANSEFNGIKLMAYVDGTEGSGITAAGVNLQVGLYADVNSTINLSTDLFKNASVSGLFSGQLTKTSSTSTKKLQDLLNAATKSGTAPTYLNKENGMAIFAAACCGLVGEITADATTGKISAEKYTLQTDGLCGAKEMLAHLDTAINDISSRVTKIGAVQNRVESAMEALDVQSQNLTSSLSTLRDTDIASESSTYIQQQILQQASATLLSTANQLPSIALNLI